MNQPFRQKPAPEYAEAYQEMCEQFRVQTMQLFLDATHITIFRDLPGGYKVNAFGAGVLTGLLGVLLGCTTDEKKDEVMKHLVAGIPLCREHAEHIIQQIEAKK